MQPSPVKTEAAIESSGGAREPLYFASGAHTLFGWLHHGRHSYTPTLGLVICKPFGYEAICSHRSLRAFADASAAIGVPVLRFDYAGTGNSTDVDETADQVQLWTADVGAAARELQRRTGVERVAVMGFRLGAVVATLAAAKFDGIGALLAVAPIVSGKRYLKELRTIQMAAKAQEASGPEQEPGSLEVSGFTLSAASVAVLAQLELTQVSLPKTLRVFIVDRKELPGAKPWVEALTLAGMDVTSAALPGFVRMMMTAPHFSLIPQPMIVATTEWLQHFAPPETASAGSFDLSAATSMQLPYEAPSTEKMTETALRLSANPDLFAIVTEPRPGEARRRGVILLNAGATHHVGPNRMYVRLARRWAQRGYVVLRMDLAGLGDSATRADRPEGEVYPPAALEDIRLALDHIRHRYGITNITLAGLCSGAYHSLRAADAALPVKRVLMVNPLNFHWRDGMTLQDLTWLGYVHDPKAYVEQVLPAKKWKKLFTGQLNVARLLKLYGQYSVAVLDSAVRNAARLLRVPLPRDLGRELQGIAGRGTEMIFLFSRGDPGIPLLRHQAGKAVSRLQPMCRTHCIEGADHIFSQGGPRSKLEQYLSDELFVRPIAQGQAAAAGAPGDIRGEQAT